MLGHTDPGKAERDIGTHSIRKGAATYATSGSTGGPSIVSICLRCGWSLGNVMERYFRYEGAGDQFTGRVVAGLPVNSASFAVLPPHFNDQNESVVQNSLILMFPNLASTEHLIPVLRLVLASLVFHFDFLLNSLPKNHSLLYTPLFRDGTMRHELAKLLISGVSSKYLTATGIPPHVEVYKKLDHNQNYIMTIPGLVLEGVKQIFKDSGTQSAYITKEYLLETISNAVTTIVSTQNATQPVAALQDHAQSNFAFPVHHWGGLLHKIPENFEFPSVNIYTAWQLWWRGNLAKSTIPYKNIKSVDLATRKQRNVLYDWTYIMTKMYEYYRQKSGRNLRPNPSELEVSEAFSHAELALDSIRQKTGKKRARRDCQLKIQTLVRLLRQSEKVLSGDDACDTPPPPKRQRKYCEKMKKNKLNN